MCAQPVPAVAPMTAEQLMDLPDDGLRRELVDGELRETAPAGFDHGRVALNVGALLREHVRRERLGVVVAAETGFLISRDPDTVRAPDVAFVAAHRLPPAEDRERFADLAPDLVVEVVSPSERAARVVAVYLPGGAVAHRRARRTGRRGRPARAAPSGLGPVRVTGRAAHVRRPA